MAYVLSWLDTVLNRNLHLLVHHFNILGLLILWEHACLERTLQFIVFVFLRCTCIDCRLKDTRHQIFTGQIGTAVVELQCLSSFLSGSVSNCHD